MLKKLIKMGVVMSLLVTSVSAFAQKNEYPRYSFGSNWSFGIAADLDWEAMQHGQNAVNGLWATSVNGGFDLFAMKKFHHAFDLRIRAHVPTLWKGQLDGTGVAGTDYYMARYSTLTGELVWSLSNALHGYDPERKWSAPYFFAGAGAALVNCLFDRDQFAGTHYGDKLGHVMPVLTAGVGASVSFSDKSSAFIEFELNGNDIPNIFKQNLLDLGYIHGDARLGYIYSFGLTEADQAIAGQKTMLSQDNFGALNSQVENLQQQVANSNANEKKLNKQIADLQKQLNDALNNQGKKVDTKSADSLQAIINQIKADQLNFYAMPFSVQYGVDEWQVSEEEMDKVKAVARVMKDNSNVKIKVVGFADYTGSDAYNMKLSERRANEVKRLLTKKYGIAENRITVDYKGKNAPFGDAQYGINRRVSFYRVIE